MSSSISKSVDHNTGDLEDLHARGKRDTEPGDPPEMFRAKFVLRESSSLKRSLTPPAPDDDSASISAQQSAKRRSCWNSFTMFHSERTHLLSILDPEAKHKAAGSEATSASSALWHAMPDHVKAICKDAATASNAAGRNVLIDTDADPNMLMLEDGSASDHEDATGIYATGHQLVPLPNLARTIDNAGDTTYPISTKTFEDPQMSLPKLAKTCKEATIDVRQPDSTVSHQSSCLVKGACYSQWRALGFPIWKREKWLDNWHSMVKSIAVPLWAKSLSRPLVRHHFARQDDLMINRLIVVNA